MSFAAVRLSLTVRVVIALSSSLLCFFFFCSWRQLQCSLSMVVRFDSNVGCILPVWFSLLPHVPVSVFCVLVGVKLVWFPEQQFFIVLSSHFLHLLCFCLCVYWSFRFPVIDMYTFDSMDSVECCCVSPFLTH